MIFIDVLLIIMLACFAMILTSFLLGAVFGPKDEDVEKETLLGFATFLFPIGLVAVLICAMVMACAAAFEAGSGK